MGVRETVLVRFKESGHEAYVAKDVFDPAAHEPVNDVPEPVETGPPTDEPSSVETGEIEGEQKPDETAAVDPPITFTEGEGETPAE